jgi:hypothetical protein
LLKEINIFREKEGKETEMQHKTLLGIIRDEFEEEISQQELLLSNYYSRGKEFPMFILTLAQAKQVLSRESKYVRKAVLKYIENLEQKLQKSLSVEEMIINQAQSVIELKKEVLEIRNDVKSVINTVTIESNKQRKIQLEISNRVYKLLPEPQPDLSNDDIKIITRKFFSGLHKDLRNKFLVSTYKDIKVIDYEKALEFIREWV